MFYRIDADTAWFVLDTHIESSTGASGRQVLDVLSSDDRIKGLSKQMALRFATKKVQMYIEDQQDLFGNTSKHCLTADPSCYHGMDVMLGLFYSWEVGACANCVPTITTPGQILLPGDFALPDSLADRHRVYALQRRKALKDWRSLSNIISHYTMAGVDQYLLPRDVLVRRLLCGERRVEVNGKIFIVKGNDVASRVPVLPDNYDAGAFKQLVLQLDSCAVGRAGAFFAKNKLQAMISTVWGAIHRSVRDTKLSSQQSMDSDIERALLQRTHTLAIHSKPFGSGVWHSLMKLVLEGYVSANNHTDASFRYYGALWAKDLRARGEDVCLDGDDDWHALWTRFSFCLNSTVEAPKMGRWYSINYAELTKGTLFWPIKLILRQYLEIVDDPCEEFEDPMEQLRKKPRQELNILKSSVGGLKLAHQLLTHWLHFLTRVYYYVTKSTWSCSLDQNHIIFYLFGFPCNLQATLGLGRANSRITAREVEEIWEWRGSCRGWLRSTQLKSGFGSARPYLLPSFLPTVPLPCVLLLRHTLSLLPAPLSQPCVTFRKIQVTVSWRGCLRLPVIYMCFRRYRPPITPRSTVPRLQTRGPKPETHPDSHIPSP